MTAFPSGKTSSGVWRKQTSPYRGASRCIQGGDPDRCEPVCQRDRKDQSDLLWRPPSGLSPRAGGDREIKGSPYGRGEVPSAVPEGTSGGRKIQGNMGEDQSSGPSGADPLRLCQGPQPYDLHPASAEEIIRLLPDVPVILAHMGGLSMDQTGEDRLYRMPGKRIY